MFPRRPKTEKVIYRTTTSLSPADVEEIHERSKSMVEEIVEATRQLTKATQEATRVLAQLNRANAEAREHILKLRRRT